MGNLDRSQTTLACITFMLATLAGCGGSKQTVEGLVHASAKAQGIPASNAANFAGPLSSYRVERAGSYVTVTDLDNLEPPVAISGQLTRLQFADQSIALDIKGTAGQVYRLYRAAFSRVPDVAGLGFHIGTIENAGLSLAQVANDFIQSTEFRTTYGSLDDASFVTRLYGNVLHRVPDSAGLAFHLSNLNTGRLTRSQTLVEFSESPENQAAVLPAINSGMKYVASAPVAPGPAGVRSALVITSEKVGGAPWLPDGERTKVLATVDTDLNLSVGETYRLGAAYFDDVGAIPLSADPLWTSSSPSVATIDNAGNLLPKAIGTTSISVTKGGHARSFMLNVVWSTADADFSYPVKVKSVNGMLHGFSFGNLPTLDDQLIVPLKLTYWRAVPNGVPIARAKALGARYNLVLSDLFGYPLNGWPNGKPWINTVGYEANVRNLARTYRGQVDVWEIWNEPDQRPGNEFWDGTEQQFFDTYLRAYRVLREELGPNALIAGPSLGVFDEAYQDRFASFCIANGCQANVLAYHDAGTRPIQDIASKLRSARARYQFAPANTALGVREIHVNEYGAPQYTHSPVTSLLHTQYLERGGADAAARACWLDSKGVSECFNNSLGGLIVPGTSEPRAVWWAYRLFAQGVAGRVGSANQQGALLASAAVVAPSAGNYPSNAVAQVLTGVGNIDQAPAGAPIAVRLSGINAVAGLETAAQVRVRLIVINPTGEAAATAPQPVLDQNIIVKNGTSIIRISNPVPEAVYQIVLSPSS